MFVAGIDAHATYSVIAIVSNTGQLVEGPVLRQSALANLHWFEELLKQDLAWVYRRHRRCGH